MNTKFLPKSKKWFYFLDFENRGALVCFLTPSIWLDEKANGLESYTYRISLAFLRFRLHLNIGKLTPKPTLPLSDEFYGIGTFVKWASHWSKQNWSKSKFDKWLLQSDWKDLVRWGGANYHYSKIILAKEFLAYENNLSLSTSINDDVNSEDILNPKAWDDSLTLNITLDDHRATDNNNDESSSQDNSESNSFDLKKNT